MLFSGFTCVLLSLYLISELKADSWNYDKAGVDWAKSYPVCNGTKQSPVNIDTTTQKFCDSQSKGSSKIYLNWNINVNKTQFLLKNNGHTLQLIPFSFDSGKSSAIETINILHDKSTAIANLTNSLYYTYKSATNHYYCLDSIHFHWGETSTSGSEHTLDGKSFPLELHFVHFSCDYDNLGDALKAHPKDPYVLSVVAVFFQIGANNTGLANILKDSAGLSDILAPSSSKKENDHQLRYSYSSFNLSDLVPGFDSATGKPDGIHNSIINYYGSLTTPPCLEVVRWNIMNNPLTVSEYQMDKFRQLLQQVNTTVNKTQSNNFRPTQPLNGRTIFSCNSDLLSQKVTKDGSSKSSGSSVDLKTIAVMCVCVVLLFTSIFYFRCILMVKSKADEKKAHHDKHRDHNQVGHGHGPKPEFNRIDTVSREASEKEVKEFQVNSSQDIRLDVINQKYSD